MTEKLYAVENKETEVSVQEIETIRNAVAKFIIKSEYQVVNDQWNGINQADLEGYVLLKEKDALCVHKIYGFGEDSKVDLSNKKDIKDDENMLRVLVNFCKAYDVKTGKELSEKEVKEIIKNS